MRRVKLNLLNLLFLTGLFSVAIDSSVLPSDLDPILEAMAEETVDAERIINGRLNLEDYEIDHHVDHLEKELTKLQSDSQNVEGALRSNTQDVSEAEAKFREDLENFEGLKNQLVKALEQSHEDSEQLRLLLEMRQDLNALKKESSLIEEGEKGFLGVAGLATALGFMLVGVIQIFAKELIGKNIGSLLVKLFSNK